MKKICLLLFVLFLFYGEFTYVDLKPYETEYKEIEVKGEVKKPGVYRVKRHANVKQIIAKAGGVLTQGDTSDINMSMDAPNHTVIVVKKKRIKTRISINAASVQELDTLPGIGPSIAQRIVEYRAQHPFRSLTDLKNVKGIGEKLYEKLKDEITL